MYLNDFITMINFVVFWIICLFKLSVYGQKFGRFDQTGNELVEDFTVDSNSISSWKPISANITPGQQDYYSFSININASGTGFAPSYEVLVFMSGNVCQYPLYLPNDTSTMEQNIAGNVTSDIELVMSYSFNKSLVTNTSSTVRQTFAFGYVESLMVSPVDIIYDTTNDTLIDTLVYPNLYIVVQLYNKTTDEPLVSAQTNQNLVWNYKLGISETDLIYQWDERSWLQLLDTDMNSALLMSGNVTSDSLYSSTNYTVYDPSLYDVYIYTEEEYNKIVDAGLTRSLCAIKGGNYLTTSAAEKTTSRNLEEDQLRVQKYISSSDYGMSEYFYVTGLNASTTYYSFLVKKVAQSGNLTNVGGILFSAESFATKDDDTCSLIHGLDFCQGVAYAVPSSSLAGQNKTLLAETYETIASELYTNFSYALQLIPCDAELDARYSPLRTCDDCAESYKNWLCAVTFPRCTTVESKYYIKRNKGESRNSFINSYIKPLRDYYEILPCISMCYNMVRDCPSAFGFACPSSENHEDLLLNSYNYYVDDADVLTCYTLSNN